MATQPRKFSEKIALHNQKQAEGDAAFQQIMREVTDVTSNPPRNNLEDTHCSRADSNTVYRERGRSVGSVGPMRSRPVEKRIDTSPYSCGPYLSPPSADSWRRTNSDSALHQSVQNPNNTLHSPGSQRRALDNQMHDPSRTRHLSVSSDKRPRSCCEVLSPIPHINIFPSQSDSGLPQIPIGNNTGSLPDLSNFQNSFQFSPPVGALDPDDHNSPTYSSGKHLSVPIANSRYMRSPKGYMLDGSPIESNCNYTIQSQMQQQPPSLGKPQPQLVNHQHQQHNMSKQQMMHQQPQSSSQNHQTSMQSQMPTQYTYQQTSPHRQSPVSPVDVSTSDSIIHQRPSMTSYRSPQSTSRPSPQSSPVLNVKPYSNNTSPLSSAPQSPTSPCDSLNSNNVTQSYNSSNDYYANHQAQETLQQHFEQIRMLAESPDSTSIDYIINNSPSSSYQQSDDINVPSNGLIADQSFYNTSIPQQLQHYHSQTTPNTPSSIPDIVLSDYDDTVRRDGSKDFSCDVIFPSGDTLRDSLDPSVDIDFQNMFSSEFLNSDPSQPHYAVDH